MLISTKGRYALSVIIDLAEHEKNGYVALGDIATRQDMSKKYLEAIIKDLVKAQMVKGVRGKGGGYKPCRSPEEYTLDEILEQMEGTLSPVACLATAENTCPRKGECQTLSVWSEFDQLVHNFFHEKKLSDLLRNS
jgi:Rrf2 family protein